MPGPQSAGIVQGRDVTELREPGLLEYFFPNLEPVCCPMSGSNCCFLTCMQISQEAGQVVQYSHLLQNFLQFIVIHTIKGFGIVNKAEIDVHGSHIAEAWLGEF